MPSLQDIAAHTMNDLAKRRAAQAGRITDVVHRDSSLEISVGIETPEGTSKWNEANLPLWLLPLVQNVGWARRFASLLNNGHYAELSNLVEHIVKTAHTSRIRMMNVSCSKANWPETLRKARERMAVERTATGVCERLGLVEVTAHQVKAIYKAVWRLKAAVMRYAVTVQEMHATKRLRTDRFKYFCWLTSPAAVAKERGFYAASYATQ